MRKFFKDKKKCAFYVLFVVITLIIILLSHRIDNNLNKTITDYIQNFGWKIELRPSRITHVKIPQNFDEIFVAYNQIQLKSGFNLENFKGRYVVRYSYKILNYDNDKKVFVNIYVCHNKVIAADISSQNVDGFVHEIDATAKCKN
jgi:hypothetical protein